LQEATLNTQQDGNSPAPLPGKALDWADDGGQQQAALPQSKPKKERPPGHSRLECERKADSHLDDPTYFGNMGFVDQVRAFGEPMKQYQG
jgi:hypothetical protein